MLSFRLNSYCKFAIIQILKALKAKLDPLDRTQQVKTSKQLSTPAPVRYGVPQGSILGPLLFTIFINNLPTQCTRSSASLFADDTTIVACGKSPAEVKEKLEHDLRQIYNWLHSNCLKANKDKSNYMFLSNKQAIAPTINFGNVELIAAESVKILGYILDNKLSMKLQVDAIMKKANSGTYAIRQASRYVNKQTRIMMYNGIIGSSFNYCDVVTAQADKTQLDRLQVAQKKALRAVAKAHPLASTGPIRRSLGWLNLDGKRQVHMATTVWKCLNGSDAPAALSALVTPFSQVHDHGTRAAYSNKCQKPTVHLVQGQKSFAYQATTWWNQLPIAARTAKSSTECRNAVYRHLLAKEELEYNRSIGKANNYTKDAYVYFLPHN